MTLYRYLKTNIVSLECTSIVSLECKIYYPDVPSAIRPVPHSDNLPIPIAPLQLADVPDTESDSDSDSDYIYQPDDAEPKLFS